MPRAGHKDGCQCAVCKRMVTQQPVEEKAPVVQGVPVGTLEPGRRFKYQPAHAIAANAPFYTYIVHRTVKGMVTAGMVAVDGAGAGNFIELSENTIVLEA